MTTTAEVYFLVRVGSWDEDDLENWVQERVDESLDAVHGQAYDLGHKDGVEEGLDTMYKEALEAVKSLR